MTKFALLGARLGAHAAAAAKLVGRVIADQIFGFTLRLQPYTWLPRIVCGGASSAGGLSRSPFVLNQPPRCGRYGKGERMRAS